MPPETLRITSADGATHDALVSDGPSDLSAVALIVPAMGVPARFYVPFAHALLAVGVRSIAMELRGTGTSSLVPSRQVNFGYDQMVRLDLPAAVAATQQRFGGAPVHAIGHSLGGQLAALALARDPRLFASLCLVASGSVDHRGFAGLQRYSVLVQSQLAGVIARILGYFPGHRLGFGGIQPRQLVIDWSRQIRTGMYRPAGPPFDYEQGMGTAPAQVLAISLVGDTLSTADSMDRLCCKLARAHVQRHHLQLDLPGPSKSDVHFRWVRHGAVIARMVCEFVAAKG